MDEARPGAAEQVFAARARARRMRARYALAVLGVALLLFALVVLTIVLTGLGRRDAALERIRARGEPVLPEDVVWPECEGEGREAREWLERIEEVAEAWREYDVGDPRGLEEQIARRESEEEVVEEALAVLRGLFEVYTDLEDDPQRIAALWRSPYEPGPGEEPSEERLALLRVKVVGQRPVTELCGDVCRLAPLNPKDFIERDPDTGLVELNVPYHRYWRPTFALADAGLLDAAEGRPASAVGHLERALCTALLHRDLGWQTWSGLVAYALSSLRRILALVPPDTPVHAIERRLADLPDPVLVLKQSLMRDRARANAVFAGIEDEAGIDWAFEPGWRLYAPFLPSDQATHLEDFERLFAAMEEPYSVAAAEIASLEGEIHGRPAYRHQVSMALLGWGPRSVEHAYLEKAQGALALVALAAFQGGEKAAAEARERHLDPFTGGPLDLRVEPGGILVIESSGKDVVRSRGEELVWRVRLP